ncbi:MAG: DUF624 domain-containing protein [Hungatella sp.]|nr:DUF624 domain-containing protein [Hungatella sp.]
MEMKGKFWDVMERLANIFILNTLFVVSCLPVVTAGAALAALYETWFQLRAGTNSTLFRTYKRAFGGNFKQATFLWLFYLFAAADVGLVLWGRGGGGLSLLKSSRILQMAAAVAAILYIFTFLYLFPVMSYFRCSLKQCLINAAGLSFCHLPQTLGIIAVWIFSALLIWFVPFLFMLVPAAAVRLTAGIMGPVFQAHTDKPENGRVSP